MATQTLENPTAEQLLEIAKRRGVNVLVTLPGSGGSYIAVDKKDFIRQMNNMLNPLRPTLIECTWYFEPVRKNLYAA